MKKISDQLGDIIGDFLDDVSAGDDVSWEMLPIPPNPQQGIANAYLLLVNMPSPVLGQTMQMGGPIQVPLPIDEEGVRNAVRAFLEGLRDQRTQLLNDMAPVSAAEKPVGVNGLVMP